MVQGQSSSADDIEEQGKKENRSSGMQVLLVRTVEKVLDGVCARLKSTAWNALLDRPEGLAVLQVAFLLYNPFSIHQFSYSTGTVITAASVDKADMHGNHSA